MDFVSHRKSACTMAVVTPNHAMEIVSHAMYAMDFVSHRKSACTSAHSCKIRNVRNGPRKALICPSKAGMRQCSIFPESAALRSALGFFSFLLSPLAGDSEGSWKENILNRRTLK